MHKSLDLTGPFVIVAIEARCASRVGAALFIARAIATTVMDATSLFIRSQYGFLCRPNHAYRKPKQNNAPTNRYRLQSQPFRLEMPLSIPNTSFFFFLFGCVHADTISSWFRLQNWPYWGGKKCSSLQVSSPSPECSLNISPILSSYTIIRMCPCNLKLHREEGHPTIIMPSTSLELTREGQIGQG